MQTDPFDVARSGQDDPNGGFAPFSFIGVEPVGDGSLVSFVRERWDAVLEISVWLDERHGSGLFDPRPEVFLETAWY